MESHFSFLDGSIVGVYLLATMIAGVMVRKYVGKVEHFLVAGREMNVFLGIASLAATEFGIVSCMYTAQNGYKYGFAGAAPGIITAVAMFVVGVTGFCIKPLRDAGVITIPELFQQRFGSKIRWLSGVVIVLGGLLNMGVFLRTGGEFLVYVTGMNAGYLEETMTLLLLGVAIYTILGGMLSVLVTDFLQFVVMSAGLVAVTFVVLYKVGWSAIIATVETKYGAGGFNPFLHQDMGWTYILFNVLLNGASVITWQTMIARVLAARDTKTARKVYSRTSFFFVCRFILPGIWGMAALATLSPTVLQSLIPADQLAAMSPDEISTKVSSLAMPHFLSLYVPTGLMGLLIAAMLAADMSTDSSYMLTWGGVIYNDIMAPFRRSKWSERKGILWNRVIIAWIGVFLLIYGLWYPLKGDLWRYLMVTGAIYMSSMSVLLIACCYWKRANNWGAAGAIIFGAAVPITYLVLEQTTPWAKTKIGADWAGIASFLFAALAMIVGSLLKPTRGQVPSRREVQS